MKKGIIFLLVLCIGFYMPAWADNDEDLEDISDVEVEKVELRDPLDLECAALEYMLAYEAYVEARASKDPAVRANIVTYMKDYRNAYAAFLMMLREDKLIEPNKPKNPAGWYNKKHKKLAGKDRVWEENDAKILRNKVKEKVKTGASPKEIRAFIEANLPTVPLSYVPDDEGGKSGPTVVTVSRPAKHRGKGPRPPHPHPHANPNPPPARPQPALQ